MQAVRAFSAAVVACAIGATSCADHDVEIGSSRAAILGGGTESHARGVVAVVNTSSGTICSGVVVTRRLILTARHCVAPVENGPTVDCGRTTFGATVAPSKLAVATTVSGATPERRHGVVRVLVPNERSFCGGDLATLILPRPLEDDEASVLPLRVDVPAESGETFTAFGFGRDGNVSSGTRRRRDGLQVRCVGNHCRSVQLVEREWWADGAVCEGDSGGPAVDRGGHVIGIASRKRDGCTATVYTDVARSAGFVAASIEEAARTPESEDSAACTIGRGGRATPLAGLSALTAVLLFVRRRYPRGSSMPTTAPPPSRLRA